jgi:hypothetical protein
MHDEGGDLAPLCNDVLNGDNRSLYLAWGVLGGN